jgi:hypothetical protein
VAVVGELIKTERPRPTAGRADRIVRNWIVDTIASGQRAIRRRATVPAAAPAEGSHRNDHDHCRNRSPRCSVRALIAPYSLICAAYFVASPQGLAWDGMILGSRRHAKPLRFGLFRY